LTFQIPLVTRFAAVSAVQLESIDWLILTISLVTVLAIGIAVSRKSGQDAAQYFLSGRGMSWWLLGMSMVATTFAADTPNLVTDLVRQNGVAGNWVWWATLLTGMLTVFVYARLWRRSEVLTDLEFYEIRYGGRPAAFLRGFRAVYLGVLFNVIVMAIVMLAAIKMGQIMLGFTPLQSILGASLVTIVFSTLGGFRGVVLTDALLFFLAMTGSIVAAVVAVNHPAVGGLSGLFAHETVNEKLALVPAFDWSNAGARDTLIAVLIVPLSVQWWSTWYPGAEPGGGGYLAQRMLAARTPQQATAAVMFFNVAHFALRPWPWILVALASLVVFPEVRDLQKAFPQVTADKLGHDLAYPAMLTNVPPGWLGIVLASLMAAYMSTISTQLNWGASYVVNDVYRRFIFPEAPQRHLVMVGRLSTAVMMVLAGCMAMYLSTASQGFYLLLQVGAGTGLLFILRWFWWRINSYSELSAMIISFAVAVTLDVYGAEWGLQDWQKLCVGVLITTIGWLGVTFVTPVESEETLESFCRLVRPSGPGWKPVYDKAHRGGSPIPPPNPSDSLPLGILRMLLGCIAIYSALFATGYWLYGEFDGAMILTISSFLAAVLLAVTYRKAP